MLKISRLRFSVSQGRDSTPGPWPGPDPLALGRDRSRGAGPWHVHWPWYGGQFVCADVVLNQCHIFVKCTWNVAATFQVHLSFLGFLIIYIFCWCVSSVILINYVMYICNLWTMTMHCVQYMCDSSCNVRVYCYCFMQSLGCMQLKRVALGMRGRTHSP